MNWLNVDNHHSFSIYNLPYGIFDREGVPTPGVAIGDHIIDLRACASKGLLNDLDFDKSVFNSSVLNPFMATGKSTWKLMRAWLIHSLTNEASLLHKHQDEVLVNRIGTQMYLPVEVGDYTDFYSSIEHATNVGIMFRDPANALMPNWKHIPVGYHGRASSIVITGTDIKRPNGQTLPPNATNPVFGPSKRLDFELEMAFVVGQSNTLGNPISVDEAEDHIFGMMVFNDWSARDIQKWEYVPLGPFLAKNFASTVSPWIVTMEALDPFRCAGPEHDVPVLPYLQTNRDGNFNIALEVDLMPEGGSPSTISKSNYQYMYWNMSQQLAHHTVNGCNARVGDLMASGTISGKDPGSYGSMLELSWSGKNPIPLANGETRTFIEDGDTIIMRARCSNNDFSIGFGDCVGKILPADQL
ncbi:MAG: fumarylacetoacetase [Flavobacteriales bacterium]|nr:fumarylacetoacetase [Bacteroidota bacterium]MCB9240248.1 fumarylacetoacetase [Flavobacteriales bacterium]